NKLQALKNIAVVQMRTLSPALADPVVSKQILGAISLGDLVSALVNRATALGIEQDGNDLNDAALRLTRALEALLTVAHLPEHQEPEGEVDLATPVQQLIDDLSR